MSRLFNGTSDYLETDPTTAVVTDYPFTVLAWVKMTNIAAIGTLFSLSKYDGSSNYQARLGVLNDGNGFMTAGDGTSATTTSVSAPLSAGTWYPLIGVWTSSTDRTVYANGASANSTTSRVLSSLNDSTIGTFRRSTGNTQYLDGRAAHVAVWNTALDSANRTLLTSGASPLTVSYSSLVAYWPLTANVSPETSLMGTYNMTVNGATYSTDDPAVSRINPAPVALRSQAVTRAATR